MLLFLYFISAVVCSPVIFRNNLTGVDDIAARRIGLALPERVHSFIQSVVLKR